MKLEGNTTPRVQHWTMLGHTTLRQPGSWQLTLRGTSEEDIQARRFELEAQRDRIQATIDRISLYLSGGTVQDPEATRV